MPRGARLFAVVPSVFAMIRLDDHAVVVSLRQIVDNGLQRFGREILDGDQ